MDRNKKTFGSFEINIHPDIVSGIVILLFVFLVIFIIKRIKKVPSKSETILHLLFTGFAGYLLVLYSREIMLGAAIPFALLWTITFLKVKFND